MSRHSPFNYIVSQILNKRCVPVAGAGVSLFSVHPKGGHFHRVPWMVKTLQEELFRLRCVNYDESKHGPVCSGQDGTSGCLLELAICGHKPATKQTLKNGCFFCDVVNAAKQGKLGNLAELYLWELTKVDDGNPDSPYAQLVKLLRIDEYTELKPTPAHIRIAWLAREALINEVITTNYDCNFEKAYEYACNGLNSDFISSLDDYRRKGAPGVGQIPRLKIFKINGCAKKHTTGTSQFKHILLTERQLQQWRNRQWAADVFKDRLRSRSLFFNGFGSDEPQIHHTLQTVLDEYDNSHSQPHSTKDVLDNPTAPVVAIYDPHPTFHQQQIVKTFALMHGCSARNGDALILRHPSPGKNLPADDLWLAIFERVYRQLLVNAIEECALAQNASFTAVVPFASSLLREILSQFDEAVQSDDSGLDEFKTAVPAWLRQLQSINGEMIQIGQLYAHFGRCLAVLKDPTVSISNTNLYVPVNENKSLISELMLLTYLLFQSIDGHLKCCAKRGLGFEIVFGNGQDKKSLFVSANPLLPLSAIQTGATGGATDLIILLGQAGNFTQPQMYRMSFVSNESIRPSTAITLSWRHIFHDGLLHSVEGVRERLLDAVRTPSNYYYQNQPSLSKRRYLKPA